MRARDEDETRRLVGRSIRAERARQGLRQDDVAEAMGWHSRSIVAEVEAGTRRLSLWEVARLCQVLDVGLGDLTRGPLGAEVLGALRVVPVPPRRTRGGR